MAQDTIWLSMVAAAAPAMPQPNPKMNSGSSSMFKMPPEIWPTMLSRLSPSARRHCPKAMLHAENGPPSRMKKAYCLA